MDGRINIPVATGTPPGIIQPFRNLGGMFHLGWPHLGEVLAHHVSRMVAEGRRVLILITYHFSRSDVHRGCAGFGYSTEAALTHTATIMRQAEHIFGTGHATVYPLICGFETDEDALLLHSKNGELLDLATVTSDQSPALGPHLTGLFPDMPEQMRDDLLRLVHGNLEWIAQVRATSRLLDVEHREWMICVGRGFDFSIRPTSPSSSAPTALIWPIPFAKPPGSLKPT